MQQRRVHAQPTVLCEEQKESSAKVTETLVDVVVNTECVSRRVVSHAGECVHRFTITPRGGRP